MDKYHIQQKNFDKIESSLMFQHIPNMKKQSRIVIPDNRAIPISLINTNKKEMNLKIELPNGYKMISPKLIKKENIDFNKLVEQHIRIMQDRDNFAIPIGEDKYFLQKGSEKYGIIKALNNYNYLLLDDKNNYVGYINTLRENADGKNVEIEIGISPNLHHNGLGTLVATKFYDELFSIGVASVSSTVFEFNIPSIKLHEKLAKLNGIRLESYYINGRLWNMNYYSKTNSKIK